MPLEVREAQLSDASALAKILLELGYEGQEDRIRRRLDRVLLTSNHVVFVAESSPHGIVGLVHAIILATLIEPPNCEIGALVVKSSHRQGGAGRALLERVQGWALRRGVEDIRIRASHQRKAAHQFLTHMGYTVSSEERVYTRDLGGPTPAGERTVMD